MTRKGWHTILVRESDYTRIKEIAKKQDMKICEAVAQILTEYINNQRS